MLCAVCCALCAVCASSARVLSALPPGCALLALGASARHQLATSLPRACQPLVGQLGAQMRVRLLVNFRRLMEKSWTTGGAARVRGPPVCGPPASHCPAETNWARSHRLVSADFHQLTAHCPLATVRLTCPVWPNVAKFGQTNAARPMWQGRRASTATGQLISAPPADLVRRPSKQPAAYAAKRAQWTPSQS